MTTSAPTLTLKTVLGNYQHCAALKDGSVRVPGVELDFLPVESIIPLFRRMLRSLDYEVSEMAVVAFFVGRQYGLPLTAIPVFPLVSVQDGGLISYNVKSGIRTPKDLEGKRVGVRGYTVTPGVWARGYLAEQGVDLSKITWVLGADEHVEAFHADAPANLEYQPGADLEAMLAAGEIVAGLQVAARDNPDIQPLFPRSRENGIETFKTAGVYRLGHLVLIRDDVLKEKPTLPRDLFGAFKAAKQAWLTRLGNEAPKERYDDPLLIGMDAARPSLEALMRYCVEQGVLKKAIDLDALFPGNLN
jgi:4,5-dihydroxyphthalate decarboxylase